MSSTSELLVECYLPGVTPEAVALAGERIGSAVRELVAAGVHVTYRGAILMGADEVVFHRFRAPDAEVVAAACLRAGLAFERVVEALDISAGPRPPATPTEWPGPSSS